MRRSAKILVLGDSRVGKTSLVHLICHSEVAPSPPQITIGCSIDVKVFDDNFLEFWDIGGSRSHKIAREFLYREKCDGIILVYDATNKKSRSNLNEWLQEASRISDSNNRGNLLNVPTLTIATKKDQLPRGSRFRGRNDDFRVIDIDDVIYVNTLDRRSLEDESGRLNDFFRTIFERRQFG